MKEEFRVEIEDRGERGWDYLPKRFHVEFWHPEKQYRITQADANFRWFAVAIAKHNVKSARRKDKRQARAKKTEHRIKV